MNAFEVARQHLETLIEPGTPLLVHSALENMGGWDARPHDLIQFMLDRLGADGCLLMPTHTSTTPVEAYIRADPLYNPAKTPARTGALPAFFLKYFQPRRSLHAWLSVAALGRDDDWYVRDHHTDPLPLGRQSPYYRVCERGGKVLLLGVGHPNNAIIHVHENLVYPRYPYPIYEKRDATMRYLDADGAVQTMLTKVPRRPPYPGFRAWGAYLEARYPAVFQKITTELGYEITLIDAAGFLDACQREYDNGGLCLYHPRFTYYPSPLRRVVMAVKRRLGIPPSQ